MTVETALRLSGAGTCVTANDRLDGILASQLDSRHWPCNFVELMPRLGES